MNTELAINGVEVYSHRLFELADRFIAERLQGDESGVEKRFRELIFFMADRIDVPNHDDIRELDNLFDAFVRLCVRYNRLPTLEAFSFLTKIHRSTFDDWKNMRYRSSTTDYADTIKGWHDTCKSFVIDELSNSRLANVNLIFTAKSAYGMRETAPVPAEPQSRIASQTPEEIAAKYGKLLTDGEPPQLPELPEVPD